MRKANGMDITNYNSGRCPAWHRSYMAPLLQGDVQHGTALNFDFEKMESFLKTELLTVDLSKVNF
ncbi:MAG TPA: hypothetical protein DCZ94_10745 [Lentisphaeria bacterium]|nr:MAG: hypothetical protein A2X48_06625 [Lentisphaerae bacterium GWF2_49_21]HBC87422.1 hypothetical protein [Lentisphaeria bacterium]